MSLKIDNIPVKDSFSNTSQNYNIAAFKSNPLPQDRVEISQKKKEPSYLSTFGFGAVVFSAIGLGVELFCCKGKDLKSLWSKIKGEKKIEPSPKTYIENIEKIQEYFNKIFDKNLTKDEANEMALKYKEAFNEKENLSFISKLFNQLNKDYGIPLKTAQSDVELGNAHGAFSVMHGIKENGTLSPGGMTFNEHTLDEGNRKLLVQTFAHELKHAQQMKICLGVDKRQFIENNARKNLNHAWYQDALRARGGNAKLAMDDYVQKIESTLLLPEFRNIEKIENSSPLYQRGLNYMESWNNYIKCTERTYDEYRNQLVEREAHDAGDKFAEIYEMLTK